MEFSPWTPGDLATGARGAFLKCASSPLCHTSGHDQDRPAGKHRQQASADQAHWHPSDERYTVIWDQSYSCVDSISLLSSRRRPHSGHSAMSFPRSRSQYPHRIHTSIPRSRIRRRPSGTTLTRSMIVLTRLPSKMTVDRRIHLCQKLVSNHTMDPAVRKTTTGNVT